MQTQRHCPRLERRRGNNASHVIQVLGVDEKAVDSASLQRIAELKAFRLVREGSDLQAIEGAEIAHVGLLDARLEARELLVLLNDGLPQRGRFGFGSGRAVAEIVATTAGRTGDAGLSVATRVPGAAPASGWVCVVQADGTAAAVAFGAVCEPGPA